MITRRLMMLKAAAFVLVSLIPDTESMQLPHGIPDFGSQPTFVSTQDGEATDPATWGGRLPGPNDVVRVDHKLTHCGGSLTVRVLAVAGELDQCNSELRCKELIVYPSGTLEINPGAKIVIRNLPTDDATDPLQWGTGVLCFGKLRATGTSKNGFVRLAKSVKAGDKTLTLGEVPIGWLPGDKIFVPDTRQLGAQQKIATQSEPLIIQSVSGVTVNLERPALYAHAAAINADGVEELFPHVGNLTRDVVIESEDPAGTRGHVTVMMRADAIIRNVTFRNLGRTTTDLLDSTVVDPHTGAVTHKGTNQVGRYNGPHMHHLYGPPVGNELPYQYKVVGCAVDPGDGPHKFKWGIAVHQSHFGLVADNIVWNCPGAGIVTEDGNEYGNLIKGNFCAQMRGIGPIDTDVDGVSGDGFWLHGPWNKVQHNVIADAKREAIAINTPQKVAAMSRQQKSPTKPGQDPSEYILRDLIWQDEKITNFDGNEAYAVRHRGVFVWQEFQPPVLQPIVFRDWTIWHSAGSIFRAYAIPTPVKLERIRIINDPSKMAKIVETRKDGTLKFNDSNGLNSAFVFAGGRTETFDISEARVDNCSYGIWSRARNEGKFLLVKDSVFRNACNVEAQPTNITETHIILTNCQLGDPHGREGFDVFMNGAGKVSFAPYEVRLMNHNGSGEDFDLFFDPYQKPDYVIPRSEYIKPIYIGQTNQQVWDAEGKSVYGGIARCFETHPRILRGFICKREED